MLKYLLLLMRPDFVCGAVGNGSWGGRNALAARCSCSRAMQGAIAPSQLGGEQEKTLLPSRSDKTVSAGGLLPGRARGQSPAGVGGNAGP